MTYISRCEHGTPMALCQKCFPDVSEHNDWSKYKYTHPVKELTQGEILAVWASGNYYELDTDGTVASVNFESFARAILRKASEK